VNRNLVRGCSSVAASIRARSDRAGGLSSVLLANHILQNPWQDLQRIR
jgi:hypothetical protein